MLYFKESGIKKSSYKKALENFSEVLSFAIKLESKEPSIPELLQLINGYISLHCAKYGALQARKDFRLLGNILRIATQSNSDISFAVREVIWGINAEALQFEESGERDCLKEACKYLKSKNIVPTIFDIGANKGEWSKQVTKNLDTFSLHIFEPNKSLEMELSGRIQDSLRVSSNLSFACINMVGVGNPKVTTLFVNNSSSEQASTAMAGLNPIYEDYEKVEIKMIEGRTYCQSKKIDEIDFLKIDTEGTELKALKSFGKMIPEGKVRFIQFEYGAASFYGDSSLLAFFELLENNYSIHRIFPEGITSQLSYSEKLETFEWSNFLAIRKDSMDFLSYLYMQNPLISENVSS